MKGDSNGRGDFQYLICGLDWAYGGDRITQAMSDSLKDISDFVVKKGETFERIRSDAPKQSTVQEQQILS